MKRFWQQANVVFMVCAGVGFAGFARAVEMRLARWARPSGAEAARPRTRLALRAAPALVAALAVAAQGAASYASRDFSGRGGFWLSRYARAMLGPLPEGSLLLVSEDLNNNAAKYIQECEGFRTDVDVLSVPLMTYGWWSRTQRGHYPRCVRLHQP